MRSIAFLGLVLTLLLGAGHSQSALAFDDSHYRGPVVYGDDVYVHHYVYPRGRIRHVYHVVASGPRHVHVVQYAGTPYVWYYDAHGGYFAPRYYYRWRGGDRRW